MPITDRDRRTLIIGGSIVGFFVLVLLIYKLFLSGGSTPTEATSPVITLQPTSSATPTQSPSSNGGGGGVVTFAGRDPYCTPQSYVSRLILLHLPVPPGSYYCPGVIVPTPSISAGPSGSGTPSGSATPTATATVPTAPVASSTTVGGRTVVLIGTPTLTPAARAQVEVDGHGYNVAVGARFAGGSFELQGVSGSCASFLYGDQAFSLCDA
ncbi:MAG: hypothetical protein QOG88_1522 [Actinomycetota bacterium]|nr:hypothetical protein [Actinomycetota bacterium]